MGYDEYAEMMKMEKNDRDRIIFMTGYNWKSIEWNGVLDLLRDAVGGLRYIRHTHGDLYGVGFDRIEEKIANLNFDLFSQPPAGSP